MHAVGLVGGAMALALVLEVGAVVKLSGQDFEGYANPRVEAQTASVDHGAEVRPEVLETEKGDAINRCLAADSTPCR